MKVRITMIGVDKEDIDYLITYDLPEMKKNVKQEVLTAYNFLSNNKSVQKGILAKISSYLKKKISPSYMSEALSALSKFINERELLEYKIISKTDSSIVFEIYLDNLFFKLMESATSSSFIGKLYSPFLLTKEKWLKKVEKAIKNDYKPRAFKIEVIEK